MSRADDPREAAKLVGAAHYLRVLVDSHRDIQQARIAAQQRGLDGLAADLAVVERKAQGGVIRALQHEPLWPWLRQFPGLRGVQTARLIATIADPRRFPGQPCSFGHIVPPDVQRGDACSAIGRDGEPCEGVMLDPRPGPGVRSLWHYLGLHVVEGRSPRKRKGQRADWDPRGRAAVLMPDGIADQIVRQRCEPYRGIYDATKARLARERGVEVLGAVAATDGPAALDRYRASEETSGSGGAASAAASEAMPGPATLGGFTASETAVGSGGVANARVVETSLGPALRPIQIHKIARTVAVKAFVGDLLTEWKRLLAVDPVCVSEAIGGREESLA